MQSTLGEGTCFRVTIAAGSPPRRDRNEQPDTTQAADDRPPARGGRVLLAEDSVDNRRLIVHMLRKGGWEVLAAENGEVACRIMADAMRKDTAIDVVLMDVQMPVVDGHEATRRIPRWANRSHRRPDGQYALRRSRGLPCGRVRLLRRQADQSRDAAFGGRPICRTLGNGRTYADLDGRRRS